MSIATSDQASSRAPCAQGTSVVLYRSAAIRRHQYTRVTEWSGGLYISPGAHATPIAVCRCCACGVCGCLSVCVCIYMYKAEIPFLSEAVLMRPAWRLSLLGA